MTKSTQSEIDDLLNQCAYAEDEGSAYPSMSYEQGISNAILWMQGEGSKPLSE